jgi:Protein of unknown function (DUF3800)
VTGKLNKKVLCFVDEYGTAGAGPFHLGGVILLARDAGRVDKCFSDLLEPSANEIHAVAMNDMFLKGLLQRFWSVAPRDRMIMANQKISAAGGEAPVLYALGVVQIVKTGLRLFQKDVMRLESIGNVEVILDANHHNQHPAFVSAIERARAHDGRFRGVTRVVAVDSAASRLLQLADLVAYSRKWVAADGLNANSLRERFGIRMP